MLDIPSTSPLNPPPQVEIRSRSRGGQPGNTNALKHGFYSSRLLNPDLLNKTSLAELKEKIPSLTSLSKPALTGHPFGSITRDPFLVDAYQIIQETLHFAYAQLLRFDSIASRVHLDYFLRLVHASYSFKVTLLKLRRRETFLLNLASNARSLYNWEFENLRLHLHPLFVPLRVEINRVNSDLPSSVGAHREPRSPLLVHDLAVPTPSQSTSSPRLTDDQWHLIQPFISALREHKRSFLKRHFPPRTNDRLLMDAILWKIATCARWHDLPSEVHVRSCQLLYRSLYRSGILPEIYTLLHHHLESRGCCTLPDLVQQGTFFIKNNQIQLSLGQSLTWEKFTALLLLQRSLFNLRRYHRRHADQPHQRDLSYRLPNLPSIRGPYTFRRPHPQPSIPFPFSEDSDSFEPIESSTAWKKWKAHE